MTSHPLLELSRHEQAVLLRVERAQLGRPVSQIQDALAVSRLMELGLIELHDVGWVLTGARGATVARLFERLEHSRAVEDSSTAPEKKAAIRAEVGAEVRELMTKIRALPAA